MRPADRAALLAAALVAAACPSCRDKSAQPPSHSASPVRSAIGVKVPLPEGWSAHAASEGTLLLGPAGRPVLRIDLKAGAASQLPSPAALEEAFRKDLPGAQVTEIDHEEKDDVTLVVLSATAGKGSSPSVVLLGAKRLDKDLYLCASIPGATADEVKLAAGACREIHVPTPAEAATPPTHKP